MAFVKEHVEPGSTVITDGWPPYRNVVKLGYPHVPHDISKSGKQAHELLPACHRVSALLKRWLLGTHQGAVKPEQLDYYLDEFTFRSNPATQTTAASSSTASFSKRLRPRRSRTRACSAARRGAGGSGRSARRDAGAQRAR
jgi:hypothetical protein